MSGRDGTGRDGTGRGSVWKNSPIRVIRTTLFDHVVQRPLHKDKKSRVVQHAHHQFTLGRLA